MPFSSRRCSLCVVCRDLEGNTYAPSRNLEGFGRYAISFTSCVLLTGRHRKGLLQKDVVLGESGSLGLIMLKPEDIALVESSRIVDASQ